MSILPKDDKQRKMLPILRMITGYFPKALREVTRVCVANNVRYNPDRKPQDINWARGKSNDQMGSLFRHILEAEAGKVFEELPSEVQAACGPGFERVYVLAEATWRALAALELQIEQEEVKKVPAGTLTTPGGNGRIVGSGGAGVCSVTRYPPPIEGCDCTECQRKRRESATGV